MAEDAEESDSCADIVARKWGPRRYDYMKPERGVSVKVLLVRSL